MGSHPQPPLRPPGETPRTEEAFEEAKQFFTGDYWLMGAMEIMSRCARNLERELAEARQVFDEHIAKVNAKLTDIEETLKSAPSAMEGTVQMNRDLVIAVRSYVQAKRDKQSAMGLNYGATDLLLSRIDAAMASSDSGAKHG